MRIKNRTCWETKSLLRLLRKCFEKRGVDIKEYTIEIVTSRRNPCITGLGSYDFKWIQLGLPTRGRYLGNGKWENPTELAGDRAVRIAQVAMHEIDHTLGLHHKDMIPYTDIDAEWARSFVVRKKQPRPAPTKEEIAERRYKHVLELIKRNERRLKLAKTRLRSLVARRTYYERRYGFRVS